MVLISFINYNNYIKKLNWPKLKPFEYNFKVKSSIRNHHLPFSTFSTVSPLPNPPIPN